MIGQNNHKNYFITRNLLLKEKHFQKLKLGIIFMGKLKEQENQIRVNAIRCL